MTLLAYCNEESHTIHLVSLTSARNIFGSLQTSLSHSVCVHAGQNELAPAAAAKVLVTNLTLVLVRFRREHIRL
jgi:hypothetical protein